MFDIQKSAASVLVGRKLDAITGVVVHTGLDREGTEISYTAGNTTGYVLEVDCPTGSQAVATAILSSLKLRGYRYQPLQVNGALADPACEIGDNIKANGVVSVVYARKATMSDLMRHDLSAPYDEEVDHEFVYEPKMQREFKRESAYARSRITQTENSITLEVTRATTSEKALFSRITVEADRITSEVTARKNADSSLGTRIDQRLDSITLTASSSAGSSTFSIKDGNTTLSTKTLDLSVKAANISGKLTVGQLTDGSVVTSSKTETEYYLSTSSSSATGGSWSTTIPTWASGKYIWTRTKTTDTRNDSTTNVTYSPSQNGAYDKNLTTALSTASSASSTADGAATSASTANSNALSASKREQLIYRSTSGGTAPAAPTAWITNDTGNQNVWTYKRPAYNSSYPACYIARQRETVGGTVTCTTPLLDATTTVIDGAHIITGTIDASKISVADLSAFKATIGGFVITASSVYNGMISLGDTSHNGVYVGTDGIALGKGAFKVTSSGAMTCSSVTITGGDVYASTIEYGSTGGYLNGAGLEAGTVTGGSSGQLGTSTITTVNTTSGINTNLGYGQAFGLASGSAAYNGGGGGTSYFTCGNLNHTGTYMKIGGQVCQLLTTTIAGNTIHYLGYA